MIDTRAVFILLKKNFSLSLLPCSLLPRSGQSPRPPPPPLPHLSSPPAVGSGLLHAAAELGGKWGIVNTTELLHFGNCAKGKDKRVVHGSQTRVSYKKVLFAVPFFLFLFRVGRGIF